MKRWTAVYLALRLGSATYTSVWKLPSLPLRLGHPSSESPPASSFPRRVSPDSSPGAQVLVPTPPGGAPSPAPCLRVALASLLSEPSPTMSACWRTFVHCLLPLWSCVNSIDLSVLFCDRSPCPPLGHLIDLPKPQRSYPLRAHNVGMSLLGSCEFSELIYVKQFPARTSFPCPQMPVRTYRCHSPRVKSSPCVLTVLVPAVAAAAAAALYLMYCWDPSTGLTVLCA